MGFRKVFTSPHGFEGEYWNVGHIEDDKRTNKTRFTLDLYKDYTQREEDVNTILFSLEYEIDGIDWNRFSIYPMMTESGNPLPLNGDENFADFFRSDTQSILEE